MHFELDLGEQEVEAEVSVLGALTRIPAHRRHVRVYRGIIGPTGLPQGAGIESLTLEVVDAAGDSSLSAEQLRRLLERNPLLVIVVDGLTSRQGTELHGQLAASSTYAGMVVLDDRFTKHWALYALPAAYRIIGDEMRVQHAFDALEADPEEWSSRVALWQERRLFRSVVLENIGVQQTIFDDYDSPHHARRRAEAAALLEDQLGGVGNDVLLRLWDLDPKLADVMHAALTTLETAETAEHRAQVALTLRRLLERFADAVFPASEERRNGRALGQVQYRNRLWAYVGDHSTGSRRDLTLSALEDVGRRIEKVDAMTNAGIHDEVDPAELHRLLIAVVALLYDLLRLAAPPPAVPDAPYAGGVVRSLSELRTSED